MIPVLYYASDQEQSFAEELAKKIGTNSSNNKKFIEQPHLNLSESGLSFFHPEARSTNKFRIDFNDFFTTISIYGDFIFIFTFPLYFDI